MTNEISFYDSIIYVSAIIERLEKLENTARTGPKTDEEREEFNNLTDVLNALKGGGGDEKWRGDWYPAELISEYYFIEYAKWLAEEMDFLDKAQWPLNCIDWGKAAELLKIDYTSIDIDGRTFFYR